MIVYPLWLSAFAAVALRLRFGTRGCSDRFTDALGSFHVELPALYPCSVDDSNIVILIDVCKLQSCTDQRDEMRIMTLYGRRVGDIDFSAEVGVAEEQIAGEGDNDLDVCADAAAADGNSASTGGRYPLPSRFRQR